MSTNFFPDLPGFTWTRKRAVNQNTLIQTSASGLEARSALMVLPRYEWTLPYSYLREGTPWFDVENLEGTYLAQQGPLVTMFFRDQFQNSVTGQFIGTGDGTTTAFQAVRTIQGGDGQAYQDPVFGFDTRGSYSYGPYTRPAALTPQAYDNGSPVSATFTTETGVITYGSAPALGHNLTATFSYVFRVRFSDDNMQFDNVFNAWNTMEGLKLIQTRV